MFNYTERTKSTDSIINETAINAALQRPIPDAHAVRDILQKASQGAGLDIHEAAALSAIHEPEQLNDLFRTANSVKEAIYGKRLVLFVPLYISNACTNECLYCAFRAGNTRVERRTLSQDEIAQEVNHVTAQGHKRILLVSGEAYPEDGFRYILDCINTIYSATHGSNAVRRLNVNIAPLSVDEFKLLQQAGIGTYQLFQETYHRKTYAAVHPSGKKADYHWRLNALDRALQAGIDDVGIGALFGLYDWRFEMLALLQHIQHLEQTFGIGCHTISVPRLEQASGSDCARHPPHPVSDSDFKKLIAILR
ncbi:MAG: [FeFe] hydrogenase H-cluster radical SAM maturase HydG, partial [Deltaproteobacteria bacterium]|nr:[FeFe] hydrogenase H-cluster radical SAM maturase HydG [Deltaproteobacteria bacterium]